MGEPPNHGGSEYDQMEVDMDTQDQCAQSFMIDVAIELLTAGPTSPASSVTATELWVLDTPKSAAGRRFPVTEVVPGRWEVWSRIDVPVGLDGIRCALKSNYGDFEFCLQVDLAPGEDYIGLIDDDGPDLGNCLWVSNGQSTDVKGGRDVSLSISWRVGLAVLVGGSLHDTALELARASADAAARYTTGRNLPWSGVPQPPEHLELKLRTAVQLMGGTEAEGLSKPALQALVRLERCYLKEGASSAVLSRLIYDTRRLVSLSPSRGTDIARVKNLLSHAHRLFKFEDHEGAIQACRKAVDLVLGESEQKPSLPSPSAPLFGTRSNFTGQPSYLTGALVKAPIPIRALPRGRPSILGLVSPPETSSDNSRVEYPLGLPAFLDTILQGAFGAFSSNGQSASMPSLGTLLGQAGSPETLQGPYPVGPVVVLSISRGVYNADILLQGGEEPFEIPLPDFTREKGQRYVKELHDQLAVCGPHVRGECGGLRTRDCGALRNQYRRDDAGKESVIVRRILQSLWIDVVKPILDVLAISKGDPLSRHALPRIWWCVTGPLSSLPIHAAGIYGVSESECLLDYAVSSYTPTVKSLFQTASDDMMVEKDTSGLFLTSQPDVAGMVSIPETTNEVRSIFQKGEALDLRVAMAEGTNVTPWQCLQYMEDFSAVHLACHGSQDAVDPLKSKFKFAHGDLTLGAIMQLDLTHADFAFLSACQTSVGQEASSGKTFNLAAGMLAAGYRRVVATMWSIRDDVAPQVAGDFYDYLWSRGDRACKGSAFDGTMSAYALHHATKKLRDRLGDGERELLAWIPYVHYGY